MISKQQIQEIDARLKKATTGTLEIYDGGIIRTIPPKPEDEESALWILEIAADTTDDDMQFYLHARDDIAALLDSVRGSVREPLTGSTAFLKEMVKHLMKDGVTVAQLLAESTLEDSLLTKKLKRDAGIDLFNELLDVVDNISREGLMAS